MSAPRTSVIILNYNGRHWLRRCLEAVTAQEGSYEVLVVDNASHDGSREEVGAWDGVRLVTLPENRGFSGGNNAGARAARCTDYLAFLNNDTVVQRGWLPALVRALDERPEAGAATSHIVMLDEPLVVDSAGDGYLQAGGAFKRWHGQPRPPGARVEEVFGVCGAAFAIRRPLFESLNGFDEDFFMVYEDVDLSYRLQLAGRPCLYVPDAIVRHAGSASLGRESATAIFYGQRNLEWTWVKNTPAPLLWRSAAAHICYSVAGCVHYATRGHGWTCLRAKCAAVSGLSRMLTKRRAEVPADRVTRIARLLESGWWNLKRREKRAVRRGHATGPVEGP